MPSLQDGGFHSGMVPRVSPGAIFTGSLWERVHGRDEVLAFPPFAKYTKGWGIPVF
jgi:hypothetical protein